MPIIYFLAGVVVGGVCGILFMAAVAQNRDQTP